MPALAHYLCPKAQVSKAQWQWPWPLVSVVLAEGAAFLSTEAAVETLWGFPWQSRDGVFSGVPLGGLYLEGKEKLPAELTNLFLRQCSILLQFCWA